MARNKIGLQFKGWEDMLATLDTIGGASAMKKGVENALIKSKEYVNPKIESCLSPGNLPAGGKYGSGQDVRDSIDKDMKVNWDGGFASIDIGMMFDKIGLLGVYLMRGTQSMKKVDGLYDSIYGSGTIRQIKKIQEEAIGKTIADLIEGK